MTALATHPTSTPRPRPAFFTPGVLVVLAVAIVGTASLLYRFAFGLGAATNLNDAYPWGIWISLDVACGVALAAGGFTTSFVVHILHRESLHALMRPALLTAMIGYTFVALGVMTDLGRFWAMWHVMLPGMWQPNSVLFEVAICVMCYLTVLYIEFLPIAVERFRGRVRLPGVLARLDGAVEAALGVMDRTMNRVITVFVVLGIMLSCMHQSSLGTLMVIAQDRLDALWQTPLLPLLFLLSAFCVGFPMVIFESIVASRSFGLPPERQALSRLAAYIPGMLIIYLGVRVFDLLTRGMLGHLVDGSLASIVYLTEVGLGFVAPLIILLSARRRRSIRWLFVASSLVILGVVMNRTDVFLIAYTPALTEIAVTAGFVAIIVLLYRLVVLNFPVIEALGDPGEPRESTPERAAAGRPARRRRGSRIRARGRRGRSEAVACSG